MAQKTGVTGICRDCGRENVRIASKDRCWKCYENWRRETGQLEKPIKRRKADVKYPTRCIACGMRRKIVAKDLCESCYTLSQKEKPEEKKLRRRRKRSVKYPKPCIECGMRRQIVGKGLCRFCYAVARKQKREEKKPVQVEEVPVSLAQELELMGSVIRNLVNSYEDLQEKLRKLLTITGESDKKEKTGEKNLS